MTLPSVDDAAVDPVGHLDECPQAHDRLMPAQRRRLDLESGLAFVGAQEPRREPLTDATDDGP